MIKSMTAYSMNNQQLQIDKSEVSIAWEVKTVNHRYLDISLSLPESFNQYENHFKGIIQNKIARGKLDAKLTLNISVDEDKDVIPINKKRVEALLSARHMLESISKKPVALSGMDILNWPGVLDEKRENGEIYKDSVEVLLDQALAELIVTREDEGERLQALILLRCKNIVELVKSVRVRREVIIPSLREKVLKKLASIDVNADPNRLEQEMVFQAQRLDVDEELDRIDSHIKEIRSVLSRDEPVGRRLDFLMQELHREANTLASKSNDAETTCCSVDIKVLIEQMREQCLNIE